MAIRKKITKRLKKKATPKKSTRITTNITIAKKTKKKSKKNHLPGRHPNQTKTLQKNAFKKGKSGNPKGRPTGVRNFKSVIQDIIDRMLSAKELETFFHKKAKKGRKTATIEEREHIQMLADRYGGKVTMREAMVLAQALKAVKGDTYAFNAIADREEGKPSQVIHNTTIGYEDFLDTLPDPGEDD